MIIITTDLEQRIKEENTIKLNLPNTGRQGKEASARTSHLSPNTRSNDVYSASSETAHKI